MPKNFIGAITTARLNAALLTGGVAYDLLGTLTQPCFMVRIVNDSNLGVDISTIPPKREDFVRAGTDDTLLFQANSQPSGKVALLRQGTKVYIRGTPVLGTAGFIYLVGYYQER